MAKIGALTIGQSPRPDILSVMGEILVGVEIAQAGALDDLADQEIGILAPGPGEYVLVTRLRDGREVVLARERIHELVQRSLDGLAAQVDLVVFLCTGEFPGLRCDRLLIEPAQTLRSFVRAAAGGRRVGVLVPHIDQVASARERWGQIGGPVGVEAVSPHGGADFPGAARSLREGRTEVVVMDCMGYTTAQKRLVVAASGLPTILAASAVARVVQELVG